MFWFGDPTYLLLVPAILLGLYAQWKVNATFSKYSQIRTQHGQTGAEVAAEILEGHGTAAGIEPTRAQTARSALLGVRIQPIPGSLTDHYDPGAKVLRLSESVYGSNSIAAVSVAAHEAGHALQHSVSYPFLGLRSMTVPVANIGSTLTFPLIFLGFIIPHFFLPAINIAILLYLGVVAFTIITLPVEFNASRRALLVLEKGGYLTAEEMPGARAVLSAAALTYVAATLSAVLMLLRLLILRNMSRD